MYVVIAKPEELEIEMDMSDLEKWRTIHVCTIVSLSAMTQNGDFLKNYLMKLDQSFTKYSAGGGGIIAQEGGSSVSKKKKSTLMKIC